MALSFCSELNSKHIKPEWASYLLDEPEPPEELLDHYFNFDAADVSLDQVLEQSNELLYPENYEDVLTYLNPSPESLETNSPDAFPTEKMESWHYPKCQKIDEDNFSFLDNSFQTQHYPKCQKIDEDNFSFLDNSFQAQHYSKCQKINEDNFSFLDNSSVFLNDWVLNQCPAMEPLSELIPSLPEFPTPPRFTFGYDGTAQKSDAGLSAQSISARQRRRKIAEKLEELGKLVPGGTKMNTAEMLTSAYKYVKFMQAQVGIMELTGSFQEAENPINLHELQCLLPSPVIQEKLYSKDKCLVPLVFVNKVVNDNVVACKPSVVKEIGRMMQAHYFPSYEGANFV